MKRADMRLRCMNSFSCGAVNACAYYPPPPPPAAWNDRKTAETKRPVAVRATNNHFPWFPSGAKWILSIHRRDIRDPQTWRSSSFPFGFPGTKLRQKGCRASKNTHPALGRLIPAPATLHPNSFIPGMTGAGVQNPQNCRPVLLR